MGTSTMILTSKHEIPRTDQEPQTNAKNAYVCATRWFYYGGYDIGHDGKPKYSGGYGRFLLTVER
jgi:hypothetical protein